jgi:hypothetical protein
LRVETQGGFELEVDGDLAAGRWSLSGDARVIAEGELLPGALAAPSPPGWAESPPGRVFARQSEREG